MFPTALWWAQTIESAAEQSSGLFGLRTTNAERRMAMRFETVPMEQLAQLLAVQLDNGLAPLRVTGSSMHPTLRDRRDTVFLKAVGEPLRKGDLILYLRDNGSYILHRIVGVKRDGRLVCSGDNQYVPEIVEAKQVLAVVDCFCRGKKTVSSKNKLYRLYVWGWTTLFPVRRPVLALRRVLGKLRRKWRKRK